MILQSAKKGVNCKSKQVNIRQSFQKKSPGIFRIQGFFLLPPQSHAKWLFPHFLRLPLYEHRHHCSAVGIAIQRIKGMLYQKHGALLLMETGEVPYKQKAGGCFACKPPAFCLTDNFNAIFPY
jgi:hypothetical protein